MPVALEKLVKSGISAPIVSTSQPFVWSALLREEQMNALGLNLFGRVSMRTRVFVAALALMAMSQSAFGQLAVGSMPTGCWKMTITADAAAKAAGRLDFYEYVYFEGMTFDGQEIARLGFDPGPITGGVNALGQTTFSVTLKSNTQGTVVSTGIYLTTSMSGTLTWTRPDGRVYTYNFTGVPYTQDPNIES